MDTTTKPVVSKTYISGHIKLDFFNNSNLKSSVQNRISDNTGAEFIKQLQDIRGEKGTGVSFSEITLLALAYFYSEIFTDKIVDEYYTIEYAKAFLDGNNLTTYTAIYEIDVEFFKLEEALYFKHCWLIIQSAWFFNSDHFGHHQYIDYVDHYGITGEQLPINLYRYDKTALAKKYKNIDDKNSSSAINGYSLVNQSYYSILFLICKELYLPTIHFNVIVKDNREYNPLTKTSRQLRSIAPFKIIECDIKSAFPTFLDVETEAALKDHVYNNLMYAKGISRGEAKILFNTVCNSGQYNSKEYTISFFLECGYTQAQCDLLIKLTHDPKQKFYSFMTEYEALAIWSFTKQNNLQRGTRLHDALFFIDDKTKPTIIQVDPNCDFEVKELNLPVIRESFCYGVKRLSYAYINSIPKSFNLITKHDGVKPPIKGESNGFRFYIGTYKYISASFNLNNYFELKDKDPKIFFYMQCDIMLSTLRHLNRRDLTPFELLLTLKHLRVCSNYIFSVRALYLKLVKGHWNSVSVVVKERDYDIIELKTYVRNIEYLNALNEAKKQVNTAVNYYNLFALLQERIENDDYGFLDEALIEGKRVNNRLTYAIINDFNLLVTGRQRKERSGVKKDPLYNSSIKSVLIKSLSLKVQQQNAFVKKRIAKYEQEVMALNRLINNREKAKQLFLVVCELAGMESEIIILPDSDVINGLKAELLKNVNGTPYIDVEVGSKEFDLIFGIKKSKEIKPIVELTDNFDTDLSNSVFNHIDIEEACSRGEIFVKEYEAFHGIEYVEEKVNTMQIPQAVYRHPEIDFDK